jgi:16S rRNA (cytosine1402-N4)-methyltransferase
VRYSGKNPRRFAEKYKEHNPEKFAADVAKVIAAGKTPAGMHRPIMVAEILEVLQARPGDVVVDGTLGYGGHAKALMERIRPGGRLIGFDVDSIEMPRTVARLRSEGFGEQEFTAIHRNFAGISQALAEGLVGGVDCVLADLGVSSMQLDNPERGFTFKFDGPLDLRLNPSRGVPASAWLATVSAPMLAEALRDFADEPNSGAMAEAILAAHATSPIQRTKQLAGVVREFYGRAREAEAEKSVRRIFQALRIAVNDEFGALEAFLRNVPHCVNPGGRVAILTFHSGEDRRVKHAFREGERAGVYSLVSDEVILAGPEERRSNPRAVPAKLRWAERASDP